MGNANDHSVNEILCMHGYRDGTEQDRLMLELPTRIVLAPEEFDRVMDLIENPKPPTEAMRQLFDPAERAREKQASRDEDARALASGEKTVEQLRRENSAFAFPRDRVRLTYPKKEK